MPKSFLLMIGERVALAWVLRNARMACSTAARSSMRRLTVGDEVFLVTTRSCFHNPTKDRTRIVARAVTASPVQVLPQPVRLMGRDFTEGCDLTFTALSGYRRGVELAPLVDRLEVFPNKGAWSARLRRTIVALPEEDARLIGRELDNIAAHPEATLDEYLARIKPVGSHHLNRPGLRGGS